MRFSKEAYRALESIVGSGYISDDPAVCEAYSRGGYGKGLYDVGKMRPACVVLPDSTEKVQAIVRLANRYKFPYIPFSTFYIAFCAPLKPNTVMIDLKRMDRIEIDEDNMYAIVEPYVTIAQLQTEAFKKGLYTMIPLCGSQVSALANHSGQGMGQLGQRTGYANRRLLAAEWVLPNGEILRIGSASSPKSEYFWGEGPGPDLRGLLRGYFGNFGGLGIITKMAVKLFSLPFRGAPEPWGITPSTGFTFPTDRFSAYNLVFDSAEKAIEAMYEIGKAEIAAACLKTPRMWRYMAKASSREHFREIWLKDQETIKQANLHYVRVILVGFTSKKQLEYEEKVLEDIVSEIGGTMHPASKYAINECFKAAHSADAFNLTGSFFSQKFNFDSLDHSLQILKNSDDLKKKYIPFPFIDDIGEDTCFYIVSYDFGHFGYAEMVSFYAEEDAKAASEFERECVKDDINKRAYPGAEWPNLRGLSGPHLQNYHELLKRIRKVFDPNGLSNRGLVAATKE